MCPDLQTSQTPAPGTQGPRGCAQQWHSAPTRSLKNFLNDKSNTLFVVKLIHTMKKVYKVKGENPFFLSYAPEAATVNSWCVSFPRASST